MEQTYSLGPTRKRKFQVGFFWNFIKPIQFAKFFILYRNCVANSKLALREFQDAPRPSVPNSQDFENHISWDFAEAVQIPYSSQQEVKLNYLFNIYFYKI